LPGQLAAEITDLGLLAELNQSAQAQFHGLTFAAGNSCLHSPSKINQFGCILCRGFKAWIPSQSASAMQNHSVIKSFTNDRVAAPSALGRGRRQKNLSLLWQIK